MKFKVKLNAEDFEALREIINANLFENALSKDSHTRKILECPYEATKAWEILNRISYAIWNGMNERLAKDEQCDE